jgi:hypothetical protein
VLAQCAPPGITATVTIPDGRLADQDVIITVPASFDEAARELTVEAATRAGLGPVVLLEEPQAAFYAWMNRRGRAAAAPGPARAGVRRRRRHHRLHRHRGHRRGRRLSAGPPWAITCCSGATTSTSRWRRSSRAA